MDSNKVNRWLTLGANLGVLLGIILILIELNQNADLMKAQMTQARADNVLENIRERQHSDHWPKIAAKQRVIPHRIGVDTESSPSARADIKQVVFWTVAPGIQRRARPSCRPIVAGACLGATYRQGCI